MDDQTELISELLLTSKKERELFFQEVVDDGLITKQQAKDIEKQVLTDYKQNKITKKGFFVENRIFNEYS